MSQRTCYMLKRGAQKTSGFTLLGDGYQQRERTMEAGISVDAASDWGTMPYVQEELDDPPDLSVPWLLPAGPACVALARHATRRHLTSVGVSPEVVYTAELLVSELTANVVKHTGGRPTLRVVRHSDVIRIEVGDSLPGELPVERHVDADADSGRGLQVVSTLATSWGYERDGVGKLTWAELEVTR